MKYKLTPPRQTTAIDENGKEVDCILFIWTDTETGMTTSIPVPVDYFIEHIFHGSCCRSLSTTLAENTLRRRGYEVQKRPAWKDWLGL